MLSLYKLEIFAAVVQDGSFSQAARRMYLTQSAISQHIQDIENDLGTALFTRGPRGVKLTPEGEILHTYTLRILQMIREAEDAVTNVANITSGQLVIGTTPGVNIYLLPQWIRSFQQRFENLTISVQTDVTPNLVNAVLDHKVDLGIIEGEINTEQAPQLGRVVLEEIDLFVIIGAEHRCWNKETVPTDALNGQPFIVRQQGSQTRQFVEHKLAEHGIKPRIVAEFDNQESIKHAVASGLGITILPEYAIRQEVEMGILQALPIEGVPLKRELKLIWDDLYPFSPSTRAFLSNLAQHFPQAMPAAARGQDSVGRKGPTAGSTSTPTAHS